MVSTTATIRNSPCGPPGTHWLGAACRPFVNSVFRSIGQIALVFDAIGHRSTAGSTTQSEPAAAQHPADPGAAAAAAVAGPEVRNALGPLLRVIEHAVVRILSTQDPGDHVLVRLQWIEWLANALGVHPGQMDYLARLVASFPVRHARSRAGGEDHHALDGVDVGLS